VIEMEVSCIDASLRSAVTVTSSIRLILVSSLLVSCPKTSAGVYAEQKRADAPSKRKAPVCMYFIAAIS
jgi:hypothetical protein